MLERCKMISHSPSLDNLILRKVSRLTAAPLLVFVDRALVQVGVTVTVSRGERSSESVRGGLRAAGWPGPAFPVNPTFCSQIVICF